MLNRLHKAEIAAVTALSFAAPVLAQYSDSSSSSAGAAGGIITLVIFCCLGVIGLAYLALKIYLTIDCLNRDYGQDNSMKIVGLLMIWIADSVLPFLSLILYYFLVMNKYPKVKK